MKRFFSVIALIFLVQVLSFAQPSSLVLDRLTTRLLTSTQLREDFSFLRKILEETHPALYRYTPKDEMQRKMDSIAGILDTTMSFYEYYHILSSLVADIRCAHTYLIPKKEFREFFMKEIKTFPFGLNIYDNHVYVILNGTRDHIIRPGFELLAINGRSMDSIRRQIYGLFWSDGYIETSKSTSITESFFSFFYYMLVDRPDTFHLTLKTFAGEIVQVTAAASFLEETNKNYMSNPANKELLGIYQPKNKKDQKDPWRLEFINNTDAALLTIRNFGGKGIKDGKDAAKKMRDFMNTCIKKLEKKHTGNLVIDLRYNGGGWDAEGVELLTFFIDSPVYYYKRHHSITDSSEFLRFSDLSPAELKDVKNELQPESDGTFTVKKELNDEMKIQHPKPNRYKGKVFFLINGRSASAAAEFTAVAHSNKLGIFIGEETGGAYEGGNGGSFLQFDLPHSKISFQTPLLYYENAVQEPKQKGRGTLPDYYLPYKIEDVLKGVDTQLEFALKLIVTQK